MKFSKHKLVQHISIPQTLANWGPNTTFVNEADSTRSSPKLSCSGVIKLMDRIWVTLPRGKSWVKSSLIIGHFWVVRRVLPPIHTQVIGMLVSFWWMAIAGRVICPSLRYPSANGVSLDTVLITNWAIKKKQICYCHIAQNGQILKFFS